MELYWVDAFAEAPFTGNPAAVCLLDSDRPSEWMQQVAREMNLSETAFLERLPTGGPSHYRLRWFTPAVEVHLCGHATLASAHALVESGRAAPGETLRFSTKSGVLGATSRAGLIELDFPLQEATRATPPGGLIEALGILPRFVGKDGTDYLVEAEDEATVRELKPDFAELAASPARGIIVTSRASQETRQPPDQRYDFVSRFFAPASGVPEDPVTGSAHCTLAPYWAARLGRSELVGYQASARGGLVRTRLAGERVMLAGRAVTVLRAELLV